MFEEKVLILSRAEPFDCCVANFMFESRSNLNSFQALISQLLIISCVYKSLTVLSVFINKTFHFT